MRLADAWWPSTWYRLLSCSTMLYKSCSEFEVVEEEKFQKRQQQNCLGTLMQTDIQFAGICMLPHSHTASKTGMQQVTVSSCWISCLQVALLLWLISFAHQLLKAVSVGGLGSVAYHDCSSTAESTSESTTESTAESAATSTAVSAGISPGCTVSWAPTCGSSRCGLP